MKRSWSHGWMIAAAVGAVVLSSGIAGASPGGRGGGGSFGGGRAGGSWGGRTGGSWSGGRVGGGSRPSTPRSGGERGGRVGGDRGGDLGNGTRPDWSGGGGRPGTGGRPSGGYRPPSGYRPFRGWHSRHYWPAQWFPFYGGFGLGLGIYDPFFFDPYFYGGYYRSGSVDDGDREGARENIQFKLSPKNTEVYAGGILYSSKGSKRKLSLPSGRWLIELRAPGYETQTLELNVEPGVRYTVERKLRKLEDVPEEERERSPEPRRPLPDPGSRDDTR